MAQFLVELDQEFTEIEDNRTAVPDNQHGMIRCENDCEYTFRSRHPFILAWVTNKTIAEINEAKFMVISSKQARLQTQLVHPLKGRVYRIIDLFTDLSAEEKRQIKARRIKLSKLLEESPQMYVEPKKYDKRKTFRLTAEGLAYLESIGEDASDGLRKLLEWAIEHKPNVTS